MTRKVTETLVKFLRKKSKAKPEDTRPIPETKIIISWDPDSTPEEREQITDDVHALMENHCKGRHHWWQRWRQPGCTPIWMIFSSQTFFKDDDEICVKIDPDGVVPPALRFPDGFNVSFHSQMDRDYIYDLLIKCH